LKRGIGALIFLAMPIFFLMEWLSSLRSVVSFAIYWSEAELTNTFEREQPFVTEKERRMILGSITLS
jgi:hypothetical protein